MPVSSGGENESFPDWSPDNSEIVFQSKRNTPFRALYIVDVSTKIERQLTDGAALTGNPDWGQVNLSVLLDHYLVYDAKTTRGTPRFERRTVALADQFDEEGQARRFAVRAVEALGNPVEKQVDGTVETIVDPDTHLVGYRIRRTGGTPRHERLSGVTVTNQFGDIVLDTREPDRLLVPSLKDPVEPVPDIDLPEAFALDHFKCYPVSVTRGTAGFAPRDVLLDDQFDATPRLLTVRRPSRLCNPAEKIADGEPVTPIARREDHLLCYTLAAATQGDDDDDDDDNGLRVRVRGIHVNNQFGPLQLDTRRIEELCVPSTKDLADAVPRDDDDDDDD